MHSFMVLSLIYICFYGHTAVGKDYVALMITWGGVNAVLEIVIAAVVCAGIVPVMGKVVKKK